MWLNRLTTNLAPLFKLYWDLTLEVDGDIPEDEPLILAPNHASFLDPWFLIWMFPRPMHHLINRSWYERSRLWNLFFRANGTVPVYPGDPESTLRAVAEVLERKQAFCVFPEGKVSPDGSLRRFRPGIAWFAAVCDVPVLPVGIVGAYECLPRQSKIPRRGRVVIRVGKPMRYPNPGPKPSRMETLAFSREVRREVLHLTGRAENGSAGERPDKSGSEDVDTSFPTFQVC